MLKKIPLRTASCIAAALAWVLLSALTVFIIAGLRDRARLIRDKDNERINNLFFASLRGYEDFGSAIEGNETLKERIEGFAIYGNDLSLLHHWGAVAQTFDEKALNDYPSGNDRRESALFGRYTIPSKNGRIVYFVFHTDRMVPRMPPIRVREREHGRGTASTQDFTLFTELASGEYISLAIKHPSYWRTVIGTSILFPLCELAFLALVWYVRRLYLHNRDYRERLEAQKNLVVLGTAASTLAHEIKNPLLSIRLQTSIVRKLFPDAVDEVTIIDEEVERLSALSYRVNDYLREAEGNRVALNAHELLSETAHRLCARNVVTEAPEPPACIFMDSDRARSVFENVIRNALEASVANNERDIGATIVRNGATIVISIVDRGKGIDEADLKRVFDPFFTRKSTGTGIGLAISKRFVEAVGGSIAIMNRDRADGPGGGTLVRISLPEYTKQEEA
ncbi:MAG: HAMP domain-containing histidine kinase [Treponema sp.]|jgi:two-component system sensor histidine kinase HydH|nr:HAMP domain-containing histidine kinase [Treponema sp.]